jgi:hypothetical protein
LQKVLASRPRLPAQAQRLLKLRTIIPLAGFDLGEFAEQRPAAAVQVVGYRVLLRFQAKAGTPLARRADPVIRHRSSAHGALPGADLKDCAKGLQRPKG